MGQPLYRSLKGEGYNTVFQRAVRQRVSPPSLGKERWVSGLPPANELLRWRSGSLLRALCSFHLMGQMPISTWIKGILPQGVFLFDCYRCRYSLCRTLKMKRCLTSSKTVSPFSRKCSQRETSPERTDEDAQEKVLEDSRLITVFWIIPQTAGWWSLSCWVYWVIAWKRKRGAYCVSNTSFCSLDKYLNLKTT